ncbi:hypothetical protein AAMO2058_001614500 [Amorphochlora amoebiformis]
MGTRPVLQREGIVTVEITAEAASQVLFIIGGDLEKEGEEKLVCGENFKMIREEHEEFANAYTELTRSTEKYLNRPQRVRRRQQSSERNMAQYTTVNRLNGYPSEKNPGYDKYR